MLRIDSVDIFKVKRTFILVQTKDALYSDLHVKYALQEVYKNIDTWSCTSRKLHLFLLPGVSVFFIMEMIKELDEFANAVAELQDRHKPMKCVLHFYRTDSMPLSELLPMCIPDHIIVHCDKNTGFSYYDANRYFTVWYEQAGNEISLGYGQITHRIIDKE